MDFAVEERTSITHRLLELSTTSRWLVASQVGVRLQAERRKGVIVSALCIGQGVNPLGQSMLKHRFKSEGLKT